jgi:hypothetical protein
LVIAASSSAVGMTSLSALALRASARLLSSFSCDGISAGATSLLSVRFDIISYLSGVCLSQTDNSSSIFAIYIHYAVERVTDGTEGSIPVLAVIFPVVWFFHRGIPIDGDRICQRNTMFSLVSAVLAGIEGDLHVINCIYGKYVDQVFFVYTIITSESDGLRYVVRLELRVPEKKKGYKRELVTL